MITLGKKGTFIEAPGLFMRSKKAVTKLFSEVAGRYGSRTADIRG